MAIRIGRRWYEGGEDGTVISPDKGVPSVGGVHWTRMAAVGRSIANKVFQKKAEEQLKEIEKHFNKKIKELDKKISSLENETVKQNAIIAEQKKRAASCPKTAQEARQKISIETG